MKRITTTQLQNRVDNLNNLMERRGYRYRYQVQARNGYVGLDRFYRDPNATISLPDSVPGRGYGWVQHSTVTVGTKREVADAVYYMTLAIYDAEVLQGS